MAGPGPSVATYAASARISSSVNSLGFTCACGPGCAIGIRPVATWNSTAAAPTPTSGGPWMVPETWPSPLLWPSPFRPWQEAQDTANSALPSATCWLVPVSAADLVLGAMAE